MSKIWDEFLNEDFVLYEDNQDSDDDTELDVGDDDTSTDTQADNNESSDNTENNNEENNQEKDDTNVNDDSETEPDAGDNMDDEENPDDQGDGSEGDVTNADDTSTDDDMGADTGEEANDPNTKLKDLEKSIFDQLSDEQKTLKIKELKSLYSNVYDKCGEIINSISDADRSPEQAKIYDYVMNSLTDLQKYIKDYLFQIYDSKTYIENMVQLQKYLTVLDTVSNIFEEVKNASDKQNKDN